MQKSAQLLHSIGKLVVAHRSANMDQTELGLRVGVGRNTISAIENGKAVNAETLFSVMAHLGLIDDIQIAIDHQLNENANALSRKARKAPMELENDF